MRNNDYKPKHGFQSLLKTLKYLSNLSERNENIFFGVGMDILRIISAPVPFFRTVMQTSVDAVLALALDER